MRAPLLAVALVLSAAGCRAGFDVVLADPDEPAALQWALQARAIPGGIELRWEALDVTEYIVTVSVDGVFVEGPVSVPCLGATCSHRVEHLDDGGTAQLAAFVSTGDDRRTPTVSIAHAIPAGWDGLAIDRYQWSYVGVVSSGGGPTDYGAVVLGVGDMNGDAIDDVAVSGSYWAPNAGDDRGMFDVFYGNTAGAAVMPGHTEYASSNTQNFGLAMTRARAWPGSGTADVNGFFVSSPRPGSNGIVHFYESSAVGPVRVATFDATQGSGGSEFGHRQVVLDYDGDTVPDLLVAEYRATMAAGQIWLLPNGLEASATVVKTGLVPNSKLGQELTTIGDTDGDGTDEWGVVECVSTCDNVNDVPRAYVYEGDRLVTEFPSARQIAGVGDVNGDAFADFVVAYPNQDVELYLGGGKTPAVARKLEGSLAPFFGQRFGFDLCAAGDVNGDGYADVAVSDRQYDAVGVTNAGRMYLFYGGNHPEGIDATPTSTVTGIAAEEGLARCAAAGDVDGDGSGDLVLSSANAHIRLPYGPPSRAPMPDFSPAVILTTTSGFSISGIALQTPNGTENVECTWSWGDGTLAEPVADCSTATHTFPVPGEYDVALTVHDAVHGIDGQSAMRVRVGP